ncbi:MAG: hypothetical protein OXM55_01795 [Bdellovibrionales bacterium]|nr:hypothetical protein [Bdellovibrionales bacterium]
MLDEVDRLLFDDVLSRASLDGVLSRSLFDDVDGLFGEVQLIIIVVNIKTKRRSIEIYLL